MRRPNSVEMLSLLDNYRAAAQTAERFKNRALRIGAPAALAATATIVAGGVAGGAAWYFAPAVLTVAYLIAVPVGYWLALDSPATRRADTAERTLEDATAVWLYEDRDLPAGTPEDCHLTAQTMWLCLIESAAISRRDNAGATERKWARAVTKMAAKADQTPDVADAAAFAALALRTTPGLDRAQAQTRFAQCAQHAAAWDAIRPLRPAPQLGAVAAGLRWGYSSTYPNLELWEALERLVQAGPDAIRVAGALADDSWTVDALIDAASDVAITTT